MINQVYTNITRSAPVHAKPNWRKWSLFFTVRPPSKSRIGMWQCPVCHPVNKLIISIYSVLRCMGCLKTGRQTGYGPISFRHNRLNREEGILHWNWFISMTFKLSIFGFAWNFRICIFQLNDKLRFSFTCAFFFICLDSHRCLHVASHGIIPNYCTLFLL